MKTNKFRIAVIGSILPLLMFSAGCASLPEAEDVAFAAITAATDGLVAALAVTGTIPAGDVAEVTIVANAVVTAAQETTTELGSSDTSAIKSGKVSGYWAAVLGQITGLPAEDQALLQILSNSIKAYVAIVAPSDAVAQPDGSLTVASADLVIPAHVKLGILETFKRNRHASGERAKLARVGSISARRPVKVPPPVS